MFMKLMGTDKNSTETAIFTADKNQSYFKLLRKQQDISCCKKVAYNLIVIII